MSLHTIRDGWIKVIHPQTETNVVFAVHCFDDNPMENGDVDIEDLNYDTFLDFLEEHLQFDRSADSIRWSNALDVLDSAFDGGLNYSKFVVNSKESWTAALVLMQMHESDTSDLPVAVFYIE